MPVVDLHDTPFTGATSRPPLSVAIETGCRRCGSSLAGRLEGTRVIAGVPTRVWQCPCGASRRMPAEVAA